MNNSNKSLVPNIAEKNNLITLDVSREIGVAAIVWTETRSESLAKARVDCMKRALSGILDPRLKWKALLIASHRSIQPDNRIIRHIGLWKSFEKRGSGINRKNLTKEKMTIYDSGIRFFGASEFGLDELEIVSDLLASESAFIIAADESEVWGIADEIVNSGWKTSNTTPPEEILKLVSSKSAVAANIYGEFDDQEVKVAAFGGINIVSAIYDFN